NVNKKLLRPLGFVIVEGVLFGLAVPGDKALAVAPLDAALIPDAAAKVEQVPHKAAPDSGLSGQLGIDRLMVEGLVLLRIVFAPGRLAVVSQIAVYPVLRKAKRDTGVIVSELANKAGVVPHLTVIPTIIEVIANAVGDEVELAVVLNAVEVGCRGQAGGVELLCQAVELCDLIVHLQT